MPVDPKHEYVDKPHAKTVHLPSQGWRYGCHSARLNDMRPRGRQTSHFFPSSVADYDDRDIDEGLVRVQIVDHVVTDWLPKACGHSERGSDAACEGCINRGDT